MSSTTFPVGAAPAAPTPATRTAGSWSTGAPLSIGVITAYLSVIVLIPLAAVVFAVALTLLPSMEPRDGQDALVLSLRLDEADLSGMPDFVEATLLKRVNEELAKESARIVWQFTHTLDFKFSLPERIVGSPRVRLYAHQGAAKMSDEGIVLAAHFRVEAS